ncbi:MAG: sarcosine oxidase subunit gamma family protein [Alphaproteobacteria bacterium]
MISTYRRHNPLSRYVKDMTDSNLGFRLSWRPYDGKIMLQGDPKDLSFVTAATEVLALELPPVLGSVSRPGLTILGLGPSEWLIVTPEGEEVSLMHCLHGRMAQEICSLIDVSDAYTVVTFTGPRVKEVLSAGCAIDLHARFFPAGKVARTLFARIPAVLHKASDHIYDVYVSRSYADYLLAWVINLKLS